MGVVAYTLQHTFLLFMKHIPLLFCIVVLVFFLTACSHDNEEGQPTESNYNRNDVSVCREAGRLEFPRLKGGNSLVIVHRTNDSYGVNYSLEWDIDKKSQRWSCYQLTKATLKASTGRYTGEPQYPEDPDLPQAYYWDKDYFWNSGFDHGHICPSADRLYSKEANYQTFFLTNMQPQYNKFNAGLWAVMENQLRTWTRSVGTDTLYVCKGGTIDSRDQILKHLGGKLIVPKHFFMALLLKNAQGYRSLAFWCENENIDRSKDNLGDYAISIDDLERKTGIDFFCNLPDNTEKTVEQSVSLSGWGLK